MQQNLPLVSSAPLFKKTVLVRVDFNVTVDDANNIREASKIIENIPTIDYISKQQTKVILFSHRSTIKKAGKKIKPSFRPLLTQIEKIIKKRIRLLDPRDLNKAKRAIDSGKNQLFLFDNTRLHPGEETSDTRYAKDLARLGDVFVYDAFASYRPEATTVGIPRFLPTYIGFTMDKEITMLSSIFKNPRRPLVAIIGGAKTEVKVGIVRKFLSFADTVVLGGSVANTFLRAWGIDLGASLVDAEMVSVARELLWLALHSRVALELPHDFMVSHYKERTAPKAVHHLEIGRSYAAFDIGPETQKRYRSIVHQAGTVVWNGPMGLYEKAEFQGGTLALLDAIATARAKKIIGGGDTITALPDIKRKNIDHISTGGGAMLVFLESGTTAPIEAIRKYAKRMSNV